MLRLCLMVFAVSLFASIAVADDKKELPKDLVPFQGTWEVVKWSYEGKKPPPTKEAFPTFTIEGDKLFVTQPKGKKSSEGTITVDTSNKPAEFNLISPSPDDPNNLGIYIFEKDTLTLCLEMEPSKTKAAPRPKEFKATEVYHLIVLKKATDKK